ncbi:unnamed protein product [Haemonchus placei]|uniref:Methyltransferase n=1 Tax=Haemonchus placei TaxID=6290 RepID=A0A0N4WF45_HAEPC|nr:unnamed protein product [Haemonchus placei]
MPSFHLESSVDRFAGWLADDRLSFDLFDAAKWPISRPFDAVVVSISTLIASKFVAVATNAVVKCSFLLFANLWTRSQTATNRCR